ncbi:MAG: Hypothetical protein BHV28_03290 [Candidatus Tokpelaia hoelldobleri]|uniref:Uncharacterized protein n=1 Tax=Candidatus Tokpelaia hoelldobleri TaxID=1902579 RepID=A0A1U9JT54_9HYPH|nr:MAG: Hypothetical protein BHV28_03290 [Candidatus Tokpelaia hoelldoblerii]
MMKRKNTVFAAIILVAASVPYAGARADSARDVALAYEEYQQLDSRLSTLFSDSEKEVRALCGASSDISVYKVTANSLAALSNKVAARAAGNNFMHELASAYYGRSQIYASRAFAPYMHERQFFNRLRGNDQRIGGIMRAVYNRRGPVPVDDSIRQEARAMVGNLLTADKVCR